MGYFIGALMVVVGLAAVIMAAMGTQNQVFGVLTGHTAPGGTSGQGTPFSGTPPSGGGAGIFGAPNMPGIPQGPISGIPFAPIGFGQGMPAGVGQGPMV